MKRIAVYCGSRCGVLPAYREAARRLGQAIGERGDVLVFGGGKIGLMGVVADAVMAAGGKTHGIMPGFLVEREQAHRGLDRLDVVETMHERKAAMIRAADHFVALPGGLGTYEELFEVLSWRHLGLVRGTVALYNVEGYYDAAAELFRHTLAEGFLPSEECDILLVTDRLAEIVARWQ